MTYDIEKDVENVARAIQEVCPILKTGIDQNGNWCANKLEIELFQRYALAALNASSAVVKLKEAEERIAELEKAQEWKPIESMPKNIFVIGTFDFKHVYTCKLEDDGLFFDDTEWQTPDPTHWTPLHPRPKQED